MLLITTLARKSWKMDLFTSLRQPLLLLEDSGTNGAQTFLWPPMWCKTASQVDPPSLDGLKLQGVDYTNWGIIMDMELKFQVSSPPFSFYFHEWIVFIACIVVHVDDFLSIANSEEENLRFESQMKTRWITSSLGEPKFCIGIAIKWNQANRTVSLSQTALIDKIVTQFGQEDAHPISTPPLNLITPLEHEKLAKLPYRSLVRCLIYLAVGTRFDISYAVQHKL